MKRFLIPLIAVCAFSAHCYATDPPAPPPIVLPDPIPAPSPPPPPLVATLGADQMYVIKSEVPIIVVTSPSGIVKSTTEAGPIKIKGKFTDGNGTYQCRTYTNKYVTTLEATGSGQVELLVIPSGSTDPAAVIRRTLQVGAPAPPPPPPTPPVPTDALTLALQAAATADKDPASLTILQANYKSMASIAPLQTFKTNAEAVAWMKTQIGLLPAAMPAMKAAISKELTATFGTSPSSAIDPASFAKELTKISNALQGVK